MRPIPLGIFGLITLVGLCAVGCSKSLPSPSVAFQGYKTGSDGHLQATFQFRNPSQSLIVCRIQIEPGEPGTENIVSIPAGGSSMDTMYVSQTNSTSLSVVVMRLVPVRRFSVPMR